MAAKTLGQVRDRFDAVGACGGDQGNFVENSSFAKSADAGMNPFLRGFEQWRP